MTDPPQWDIKSEVWDGNGYPHTIHLDHPTIKKVIIPLIEQFDKEKFNHVEVHFAIGNQWYACEIRIKEE